MRFCSVTSDNGTEFSRLQDAFGEIPVYYVQPVRIVGAWHERKPERADLPLYPERKVYRGG